MNESELNHFEAELRRARPAPLPDGFLQRLKSAAPSRAPGLPAEAAGGARTSEPASRFSWWPMILRWIAPAAAAAAVMTAIMWRANHPARPESAHSGTPMRADNVQIDQQLVSTFDTVAPLPDGEPVRFRCRQWMDEVVLRDSKRGIEVARRVPRVEVVPVRFETY